MKLPPLQKTGHQIIKSVLYVRQAPDFILNNKLWRGYLAHGWIAVFTIILAVLISLKLFTHVKDLALSVQNSETAAQSMASIFSGLGNIGNKVLFSGNMKYLILIFMEMVIFHFAVKTYEILSGVKKELTVKDFIDAEIRMIKVVIRSLIYEKLLSWLIIMVLGIFGLGVLKIGIIFIIQCYFIGVAFIDNYNEQFNITIKESFKIAYDHVGAALLFGLVAYCLMVIPIVGAIAASIIGAVATTCYMYYSQDNVVEVIEEPPIIQPST